MNADCGMQNAECENHIRIAFLRFPMASEFVAEFKNRTKQYALRVVRVVQAIDDNRVGRKLGDQLLRSGTSVGANYRAACRARSPAEFRAKLGIVEEECDETMYWIELIVEANLLPESRLSDLHKEADEILAIVVASINTSKQSSNAKPGLKNAD